MLGGHGEDVAASLEGGPLSGGRDPGARDEVGDVLGARLQGRQVGHHFDLHLALSLAGEVEQIEPSAGLEDDVRRADRREVYVEVGELRHLPKVSGVQIVGPDVVPLIATPVGQEVERATVPHRLTVVGVAGRDVA